MAGAGWHDFVPGEVLTAANVQDYLQDQAVMKFASAAARAAALPSPSQGMMSFLNDTGVVETYYAAWNATTNPGGKAAGAGWYATDRNDGLVAIVPPTVAVSGGSATVNSLGEISFSGVSSISLNSVFTSAYKNYLVVYNITSTSAAIDLWLRVRGSGSDISTNTYSWGRAQLTTTLLQFEGGAGVNGNSFISLTSMFTEGATGFINVFEPQLARPTTLIGDARTGQSSIRKFTNGVNSNSTSYDGFTFLTSSGTMTGTLQVFGYNS